MFNKKKLLAASIALALTLSTSSLYAAEKKNTKQPTPKAPIVVEADELLFSDETGELLARGNVVINQKPGQLFADKVEGNSKQNELWINGKATLKQPGTDLVGTHTHYNYVAKTGTMEEASGTVDKQRVYGHNIDFFPTSVVIKDGTMTTCPAKIPDYHISATKVEIWPGDKLIAYNAKFWIKNTVIYTMPKYQKSLKEGAESEFPQIGYNSQDGLSIKEHIAYPLTNNLAAFTDLAYYSKTGFKPVLGLTQSGRNFSTQLFQGEVKDGDGNWIKKEPELRLDYSTHRLGTSPITYSGYAIYGKWADTTKTSWHQEYYLYFNRDPISLDERKTLNLYLGTGIQHTRESFNGLAVNSQKFDATLGKSWGKLYIWSAYHYTRNNTSLFEYNSTDLGRQLDLGFSYKIDRLNTITYIQTYDVTNNRVYDQDYYWFRNLHCWQASVTYRAKRQQVLLDISVTRW